MQNPDISVPQICQQLAISRATLYRYVSPNGEVRKEKRWFDLTYGWHYSSVPGRWTCYTLNVGFFADSINTPR